MRSRVWCEQNRPAVAEAGRANAALHSAYELYSQDWYRRQHDAGEEGFRLFLVEALAQQRTSGLGKDFAFVGGLDSLGAPIGGATYAAANDAAAAAREAFEQRERELSFDELERKRWKKGRR